MDFFDFVCAGKSIKGKRGKMRFLTLVCGILSVILYLTKSSSGWRQQEESWGQRPIYQYRGYYSNSDYYPQNPYPYSYGRGWRQGENDRWVDQSRQWKFEQRPKYQVDQDGSKSNSDNASPDEIIRCRLGWCRINGICRRSPFCRRRYYY